MKKFRTVAAVVIMFFAAMAGYFVGAALQEEMGGAIPVPDDVEFVWLRTKVRKQSYSYEYSFDGKNYTEIPGTLDAAVLSDDYVLQSYGGFFTGAFVGMACVDYSGYDQTAEFRSFDYKELD